MAVFIPAGLAVCTAANLLDMTLYKYTGINASASIWSVFVFTAGVGLLSVLFIPTVTIVDNSFN